MRMTREEINDKLRDLGLQTRMKIYTEEIAYGLSETPDEMRERLASIRLVCLSNMGFRP